jgi:hypothetical protein
MGKKKQRAALEARAAEIDAELARRAEKKARKADKKIKPKKDRAIGEASADSLDGAELAERIDESIKPKRSKPTAKADTLVAATTTEALAGNDETRIAATTAGAAASEADDDETVEQIKARVAEKRAVREAHAAAAADIDRDDHEAVQAYNARLTELGGGTYLTSNAERTAANLRAQGDDRSMSEILDDVLHDKIATTVAKVDAAIDALDAEVTALEAEQVAEQVETETGRVFEVGAPDTESTDPMVDVAQPSDAPVVDFEVNGRGQYKVAHPETGDLVGYTRATTYIDCLEDKSMLTSWKMRVLLEGVAINDTPDETGRVNDPVVATVRDLIHVRDVAIAKAQKADRKGKLDPGDLAALTERAWKDFKGKLNTLADNLLETGGVHEKAQKGTDIHALTELYDREGIDAVGQLLTDGKISPADLADVEAYAEVMKRAGATVVAMEQVIVRDDLKVAGRLDRIYQVRLSGMLRATRVVGDIKTGRVDYSIGKIAQQIELYASGTGYDLETHERTDLRLNRTKGLLIHLPAGSGKATLHVVDLTLGRKGNGLAGQVRAWRNEGKRAINLDADYFESEAE